MDDISILCCVCYDAKILQKLSCGHPLCTECTTSLHKAECPICYKDITRDVGADLLNRIKVRELQDIADNKDAELNMAINQIQREDIETINPFSNDNLLNTIRPYNPYSIMPNNPYNMDVGYDDPFVGMILAGYSAADDASDPVTVDNILSNLTSELLLELAMEESIYK